MRCDISEYYENIDIPRIRANCARELRELKGYIAIDYEQAEYRYGRLDGTKIGEDCGYCPVLRDLGECSLRVMFQELANDHRIKYELGRSGNDR